MRGAANEPETPKLFVLIGAGASLDYCDAEIERLVGRGAHFFVSDSVAACFLGRWRPAKATVFTVELRRHAYLSRISSMSDFSVLAYAKTNARNLRFTKDRTVSRFKLINEPGELPALYSPGTVLGVMLSCAVAILGSHASGEIHIVGADLHYIDNQVYARYIDAHVPSTHRLMSREMWQYEMALKKSYGVTARSGYAIRTSFELMQSLDNMRTFVQQVPSDIRFIEYSPLGLDCERVEKCAPKA